MKSSLPSPTKAQSRRMEIIKREIGCIACRQLGQFNQADANHELSGGNRKGHNYTHPLCPWHHRGVKPIEEFNLEYTRLVMGPSLADGSKAFHAAFGTDEQLHAETERLVERFERDTIGGAA